VGLTAEDLWPLVSKLSPEERFRLVRLALGGEAHVASDAEAYRQLPVGAEEFRQEHDRGDPLAWDSEGWDDVQ